MVSTEFKGAGLHYTAFRDAIREDSRQITPSRGVSPRKKFAVKANVESRVEGEYRYMGETHSGGDTMRLVFEEDGKWVALMLVRDEDC